MDFSRHYWLLPSNQSWLLVVYQSDKNKNFQVRNGRRKIIVRNSSCKVTNILLRNTLI